MLVGNLGIRGDNSISVGIVRFLLELEDPVSWQVPFPPAQAANFLPVSQHIEMALIKKLLPLPPCQGAPEENTLEKMLLLRLGTESVGAL